jgi:hypothetical protein
MSEKRVSMALVWEGEGAATSWPPGRLAYGEYTRLNMTSVSEN